MDMADGITLLQLVQAVGEGGREGECTAAGCDVTVIFMESAQMAILCSIIPAPPTTVNEPLPRHFPNPMMRVQKLENLQHCLGFLRDKGIPLQGVHAEG